MSAAKRRRRQHKIGFRHLARICGKSVVGGRPIYKATAQDSVAEAIAREREFVKRQAKIKAGKK